MSFTLTYSAENGTITGTTPQTIEQSQSGTAITVVPDSNYIFQQWSDGITTATRTDTNVQSDINVTANFKTQEELDEELILSQPDKMELVAYSPDQFRNVVYTCIYSLGINRNQTTVYEYTDLTENGTIIGRILKGFTKKEYPIPEIIAMNKLNITDTQSVVRG